MWIDAETQQGICLARCIGNRNMTDCADPAMVCVNVYGAVNVPVCLLACDPLADSCVPGDVCVPTTKGFACIPDASGDGGALYSPCSWVADCDPGLACLWSMVSPQCERSDSCCLPFCDLDQPTCPDGLECQAWFEMGMAPPDHEDVGYCGALP